jgi:hypothetical protein
VIDNRYASSEGAEMTTSKKALSEPDFAKMAKDLEIMAEAIRQRPEINHHFAERLTLLAKQMREDSRLIELD